MKKILLPVSLACFSLSVFSWDCSQDSYISAQDRNIRIDQERNELKRKAVAMNEVIDTLMKESKKLAPENELLCEHIKAIQQYQTDIFKGRNDAQNNLFKMAHIWDEVSDECTVINSLQNSANARAYYFTVKDLATSYKKNEQQRKGAYDTRMRSLTSSYKKLNCQ